jgi:hypothetical protein
VEQLADSVKAGRFPGRLDTQRAVPHSDAPLMWNMKFDSTCLLEAFFDERE